MKLKFNLRIISSIILASIAVLVLIVGFMLIYPYDNFSYGKAGPLTTEEYTSQGIPVIRKGTSLKWEQPYCNKGANPTISIRWIDVYGDATGAGFVNVPEVGLDDKVASFMVPTIIFYTEQDICEVTSVFALIPDYVPAGAYYKLRIETSYSPNSLRTISSTTETELFLYLDEGVPIPIL